jgi:hypothetical protein
MKKVLVLLVLLTPLTNFAQCEIYGNIQVVTFGEDYKVKVVELGEDLKVKQVSGLETADERGKWNFVGQLGQIDYKIKFVEFGEDFTIKYDNFSWGCDGRSRGGRIYSPKYIKDPRGEQAAENLENFYNNHSQTIVDGIVAAGKIFEESKKNKANNEVVTRNSSEKKAKRKKRWKTFFIIWGSLTLLSIIAA